MRRSKEQGFVALLSVIIISAVILMYLFTIGLASFLNRIDTLGAENKRVSLGLAEACVNASMLRVAQSAPANNVCINTMGGTCGGTDPQLVCKICTTVSGGGYATTTVHALWRGAYSTVQATFDTAAGSYKTVDWREIPAVGGTCTVP